MTFDEIPAAIGPETDGWPRDWAAWAALADAAHAGLSLRQIHALLKSGRDEAHAWVDANRGMGLVDWTTADLERHRAGRGDLSPHGDFALTEKGRRYVADCRGAWAH